ncbi:ABC transporter ATP-binding protein [Roseinatronobacter sp. S2]|uniref:ABC transporter ATP-binding protein n=1 Tax=Roseinatronobacter sp. S2 TaxID=3035471 RepID=UPI00358E1AA5
MHFPIVKGFFKRTVGYTKAVDDVSFDIFPGETFGLVGESGCGKTSVGRCIIRILEPTGGTISYASADGEDVEIVGLSNKEMKKFRTELRMIFQDPFSSLNPRMPVSAIVGEVLKVNGLANDKEIDSQVRDLLNKVGLPADYLGRYPHAFSGGQRQRIGIARALASNPRLVVCDEAVSALDVSIQAQTINLLQDLQEEFGLTYLFIAHDLSVVEHISDRLGVMYSGKMVEMGTSDAVYSRPLHPYTEALLSAVPEPDPTRRDTASRVRLTGEVADSSNPPSGCYFHPRCQYAQERCKIESPKFLEIESGHFSACHFAGELELKGAFSPEVAKKRNQKVEEKCKSEV